MNPLRPVGLYQPNEVELATVRWIMEQFLKYGSYLRVLEECERKGIQTKVGALFKRHSLVNLLTNIRYMGKWYLNEENEKKDQDNLPVEQRYHQIDLPHGPVIEEKLWNDVQTKVASIAGTIGMNKNTRVNRVFPLSAGLLTHEDGTTFRGFSGTGRTQKSFYYRCDKHRLNIRADAVEENTMKVVANLIKNTPDVQTALKRASQQVQDNIQIWTSQILEIQKNIVEVDSELADTRKNLNKVLRVCESDDEAREFKNQFVACPCTQTLWQGLRHDSKAWHQVP